MHYWFLIKTIIIIIIIVIKENTVVQEVQKQCMMFVITVLKSWSLTLPL